MQKEASVIDKIRNDTTVATESRRDIASLAALGLIDFSLISLFQMGSIKKLPDLPGKIFDTQKVNSSKDAVIFGMPDGVISLGAYTATMGLALAAMRFKKQSKVLDVILGGVVVAQAAGAAHYLLNMTTVQKKACIYCIAGAVINFASLKPLSRLFKKSN